METRDYDKERERKIDFSLALQRAAGGWVIAREGWAARGRLVFLADEGQFKAKDLTTGPLDPFLVLRSERSVDPGYGYEPYVPTSSDMAAEDWIAMSRQAVTRMSGRERKLVEE